MSYQHKAAARFSVSAWSEHLVVDIDGEGTQAGDAYYPNRGITRAEVRYTYSGDIEGTSTLTYLIAYKSDAAPVLCFEHFEGSIAGHEGSCVFQHVGTQDKSSVSAHLQVVPGMGTGDLEELRGEAEIAIAGHADNGYELNLAYSLS
ncbi:DUF3224 domain-containing protein [Saccharopolyspora rhizosphaerae]|uniref:DUF3224 domain-containing protein n=1 Tax=Saccharopolyspora rhizosphaerae TaxID=2492662 RepID=A0A3R8VDT4_9PSEU|nr:DUF3224 domain-containing protein [Saccharopolyspora rhizosphaerae]RRO15503.1 DUF3224 domain-containing protein [Saccharopolyspora rhizosphaerae]